VKTLEIQYNNGETVEKTFPENLYDLPWNQYRKIEEQIKAQVRIGAGGEIEALNVDEENMGNFLADLQGKLAEVVLNHNDIEVDEVKASTVKNLFSAYSEDIEKLGLKLKKNSQK